MPGDCSPWRPTEALPPPEGHFYPWQLEGAGWRRRTGAVVGRFARVEGRAGPGALGGQGREREQLIPAVPEIVVEVNVADAPRGDPTAGGVARAVGIAVMRIDIVTLFPGMVEPAARASRSWAARRRAGWLTSAWSNLRDYAAGRHRVTDDSPVRRRRRDGPQAGAAVRRAWRRSGRRARA